MSVAAAQDMQTYGQRMALRKQNRINVLLQEKGILQLINRNYRQNILNLQNNPPGDMANMVDVNKLLSPPFHSMMDKKNPIHIMQNLELYLKRLVP
jgi:hypothetical protein